MNCRDFERALADVLNGQTASDPEAASAHLRACPACQARTQKVARLDEYLRRSFAPTPPGLPHRIKAAMGDLGRNLEHAPERVRAASHRRVEALFARTPWAAIRRLWHSRSRAALAGLAAAALVAVTIILSLPGTTPPDVAEREDLDRKIAELARREKALREREDRDRAQELERLERQRKELEARRMELQKPPTPEPKIEGAPPLPTPRPEEPRPVPPEEPKPAPREEPARPPAIPAPKETLPAIAELEDVSGAVFVTSRGERKPVQGKVPLVAGDALEIVGSPGLATVRFKDSTWLQLWGDGALQDVVDEPKGKRLSVTRGSVTAQVAKQPAGRPLVVATPQGEARVQGTFLRLAVDAEPKGATVLEVEEGRVELKRASDGRFLNVAEGQFAVMAPGIDLVARPMVQADKKKPREFAPEVDPKKVDEAVKKGIGFLKNAIGSGRLKDMTGPNGSIRMHELMLLTFLHAGVPETDPDFQQLFKTMIETELRATYDVALQAVILEEMHRVKYQWRIAQCAQFLVDNQAKNGQWSYGDPTPAAKGMPTGDARPEVASGPARKGAAKFDPSLPVNQREKPKVVKRLTVRKTLEGGSHGDPSNSQYAALGLRACHDAGIVFPLEVIQLAEKSWRAGQEKDGGWRYGGDPGSTGSMTAGAVGSLTILQYIQNRPWMKDEAVTSGLDWMAKNFTVTQNPGRRGLAPGKTGAYYFYYLYALERVGEFTPTETIGNHKWYAEGAKALLACQEPTGGSWQCVCDEGTSDVWDTCFAILFLRRATRPLIDVESLDRFKKR